MTQNITIQSDYWTGTKCLENGVPWQVPDSIYKEDILLQNDDVVLEMGTGGSTIFLATRCKKVIAVETNFKWYQEVLKKIQELFLFVMIVHKLLNLFNLDVLLLNILELIWIIYIKKYHIYVIKKIFHILKME